MNCRAPPIAAPILVLLSLTVVWSAHGQEMFKLLGEREIRARVVGKDISPTALAG